MKKIVHDFDLHTCENITVNKLTHVERKKLNLALCLHSNCKVLLLDEPTLGMDIATKRSIWSLIQQKRKDKVIVIATQDMQLADTIGDRICLLTNHAKVKLCGTPAFFQHKQNLTLQIVFNLARISDANELR